MLKNIILQAIIGSIIFVSAVFAIATIIFFTLSFLYNNL